MTKDELLKQFQQEEGITNLDELAEKVLGEAREHGISKPRSTADDLEFEGWTFPWF